MSRRRIKRRSEAGFALLLVYAMAATVAIMLYLQLPRVAFEAQRDKEQLLIDRGEQYSRAVKLYVRKFNRFPADMDALDNTQNIRFLRRHYIDPMTGKSEWRLIHVGPGGVFIDSVLNKKGAAADQFAPQNFITEMAPIGGFQNGNAQGVNLADRRRASDQPGAPGDPNNAGGPGPQNASPGDPNSTVPQAPAPGPVMVLPNGQIVPASTTGYPPAPAAPAQAGAPTGLPGQPGLPGTPPGGFQNQPNQPYQPGVPSSAAGLINQLLTTPRPGGLNGTASGQQGGVDQFGNPLPTPSGTSVATLGTPAGQGMGGAAIGGGLAGVASKLEQHGIKSYNDHTAYNEWEFVYDMTKDPIRGGGVAPAAAPPPGTPINTQSGTQPGPQTAITPGTQSGVPPGVPTAGTNQ